MDNERTRINPTTSLGKKMAHYKTLVYMLYRMSFIMKPSNTNTHPSHALHSVKGQLKTSSYQLESKIANMLINQWKNASTSCDLLGTSGGGIRRTLAFLHD